MKKDSEVPKDRDEYSCLLTSMFVPWNVDAPPNPDNVPWDVWLADCLLAIPPRILRTINHLELLHKSRIEVELHQKQLQSENLELAHPDAIEFGYSNADATLTFDSIDEWETAVELAHSRADDWGVIEALDSAFDYKYLTSTSANVTGVNSADSVHYCEYPLSTIKDIMRQYTEFKSEVVPAEQTFEFVD